MQEHEDNQTSEPEVETVVPKVSKGKLFKQLTGYSKTFKRNMGKKGLDPTITKDVITYKQERKANKKAVRAIQMEKHSKASAIRKGGKVKASK